MNFFDKKIHDLVEQVVVNSGFFLIDLVIRGERKNRVIEVYIDSEKNVSADNCAEISRDINKKFEEEDVFESGYRLDVSSPGINRPLKYLKQFPKHINRKFDVAYRESETVRKMTGTLISIDGDSLVFVSKNREEIKIEFSKIIKAKVIISFS